MARKIYHAHIGLHKRVPKALSFPQPADVKNMIELPASKMFTLFRRGSTGSSDEKPADSNSVTLPVALAVVIPIVAAIIIFVYLHRRHVKKLRMEDVNDPHKSLDFGWDPNSVSSKGRSKSKKQTPEMTVADLGSEKSSRRQRGMSMDVDLPSPYLLPPGLSGSRESLHSMTRTIHSHDDRYRPATTYTPNDSRSMHSYKTGRREGDDFSSDAGSSKRGAGDDMKQDLLGNAQRMSRSMPPTNRSPIPDVPTPPPAKEVPRKALPSNPQSAGLLPNFPFLDSRDSSNLESPVDGRKPSAGSSSAHKTGYNTPMELPLSSSTLQKTPNRKSPPSAVNITQPNASERSPAPIRGNVIGSRPPRKQSLPASEQGKFENFLDDSSECGDGFKVTPPSPHDSGPEHQEIGRQSSQVYMPQIDEYTLGAGDANDLGYDIRRLSMGVRPLPPDDPTDNPEQRANRIRSFYKEYFDESKPGPSHGAGNYYEDYDQQYLGDGAIFDPVTGQFVTAQPQRAEQRGRPYAESYGRRAMTPPPRAPPRFARQHAATLSGGSRLMPPGPRAFSSASGRFGPSGRGIPKKQLPPPMPLNVLPTPHMLKDDNFAIFNSMDFAPPTSAKDRQAGRPESPRGGLRPYSPMVPAHMPLQSSFDDLAAMPSP